MKKNLFIILFALTGIGFVQAQRMLPKQKGLEINTGTLDFENPAQNCYFNIGLTINARGGNYQILALEYVLEHSIYKQLKIPKETYTAQGGYNIYLLGDAARNISLNTAMTGIIGYETINNGTAVLSDGAKILSEENFIYGLGSRLSLETYLSDHFVFLLHASVKLFWGTSLEQFRPSTGLGLRYNF
ncbi:conjugal transfer protein TraO [Flavobacterium collinsii]|uniref:conjugal transfer protein TraO n=1 Tax=Flavobacterium collinsii TaxID=1114861 RepID=UPI003757948C